MRVDRLTVYGFMAHEKAEVHFDGKQLCFLVGANKVGKSSLVDALRWCLINRARGVSPSHVQDLVRRSSKTCSVDVSLLHGEGVLDVHRTPSAGTPGQGTMLSFLGLRGIGPLEAVMEAGDFLDMKPKEREALVFGAAGVVVTEALLRQKGVTDEETLRTALNPARGFASAERIATEKRRAANRVAEEYSVQAPVDDEVDTAAGAVRLSAVNVEEVSAGLRALGTKRDQVQRSIGALEGWREPDLAAAKETLRVHEASLALAKKAEATAEKTHGPNWRAVDSLVALLRDAQSVVDAQAAAVERASALPAKGCNHACPVHGAVTSRDEVLAGAKNDLACAEHTRDVLLEQRDAAEQAAGKTGDALDEARQETIDFDAAVRAAKATLAAAEASAKNRPSGDLPALKEELRALDARVARGTEIRDRAQVYAQGVATAEKADIRRQLAVKEAAAFGVMEAALRPGGVMAQLLAAPLARFREVFEEIAGGMLGGAVVALTDEWEVLYEDGPVALASTSEQWRIAAALALAVGVVSGLRFVILDEASVCVGEDRVTMTEALLAAGKYFDQVIVVASRGKDELEALSGPEPELEDVVGIWKVEPGRVRPVVAASSEAA